MTEYSTETIRNFSIIAHIDHGKSTLADRFLEITKSIEKRKLREQVLDSMDIERERGITIKAHPVRIQYRASDGILYTLHLIDTPGHVDFSYEVSRSLAACEGALLLVDASQGVEAQTVANVHLALAQGLEIIPVLNKIDLPNVNKDMVKTQMCELLKIRPSDILETSAKTGANVDEILESVVYYVPPPENKSANELKALIFDSKYDMYRGVIVYVRIFEGTLSVGDKIKFMQTGEVFDAMEIGTFRPEQTAHDILRAGEVGYIISNIKSARLVQIGDTITNAKKTAAKPLSGFKKVYPMVYSGFYPIDGSQYELMRDVIEKLQLNDSSFKFEPENSAALGFGFRCGFLGLLHMEVIQERLEREYNLPIIATTPNVNYEVVYIDGSEGLLDNPVEFPELNKVKVLKEPFIKAFIVTPSEYIGAIMQLSLDKRGECIHTETLDGNRVIMEFELPLNEVVVDFFDKLKSCTKGYASLDYEFMNYRPSDLVRLDIMLNGEIIDAFTTIVHKDKAYAKGRMMAQKLKDLIPKHLFKIAIQASVGAKVIARETIPALKKDVTAKCYGGDITRKRKLWEKQKEGKKKMKQIGTVNVPQKAFIEILKATGA